MNTASQKLACNRLGWLRCWYHQPAYAGSGFTLAELLIALAILGVIATFTIPKILTNSQTQKYNGIVKEAAASLTSAYQNYQLQNTISSNTSADIIMSGYLNYINIDSSTVIDDFWSGGTLACGQNGNTCYRLANGAMLMTSGCTFSTTNNNGAVSIRVDPSGKQDGIISTGFWLQVNGKLWTEGTRPMSPGIVSSGSCNPTWTNNPDPNYLIW